MDFFARQDRTRARSRGLVVLFAVALVAMGLAVHVTLVGLSVLSGGSASLTEPSVPALALVGIVWTSVALGALFAWLDVRAGGAALARGLGAVPVAERSRHADEARLSRIVAEISIAASVAQPDAFVLRAEPAINAMVLGDDAGDKALVVTRGALDGLDEHELRAVVAHEIAHVAQRDLTLNMRLVVILGGLSAIDEVGRTLTGGGGRERLLHPGAVVGWTLRALGTLGTLPAAALRASVSRQREFLADACAVQFTREPYPLASALAAVRDASGDGEPLHVRGAGRLAHLCFATGDAPWYRRPLASHPGLDARIHAIEPHFAAKRRGREKGGAEGARRPGVVGAVAAATPGALAFAGGAGTLAPPRSGGISPSAPVADVNDTGLSDRILLLLPDERSCLAALFALFAPAEPGARRAFVDRVAFGFDRAFADVVVELLGLIGGELHGDRLGIVRHACERLTGAVHLENRRRVVLKLERVAASAGRTDLASLATLALVRRRLGTEFPLVERLSAPDANGRTRADGRRSLTFDRMGEEFALLLSLVVESSGAPEAVLRREYERVLGCYTREPLPRRRSDEPGIGAALEDAFQTLYVQPKPIRQAFVQHCAEIVASDARITGDEVVTLELFAAALDCEELARPWGRTALSA